MWPGRDRRDQKQKSLSGHRASTGTRLSLIDLGTQARASTRVTCRVECQPTRHHFRTSRTRGETTIITNAIQENMMFLRACVNVRYCWAARHLPGMSLVHCNRLAETAMSFDSAQYRSLPNPDVHLRSCATLATYQFGPHC